MRIQPYVLTAILALGSGVAFAEHSNNGDNGYGHQSGGGGTGGAGGAGGEQGQLQLQVQGQAQGQDQSQVSKSNARANATGIGEGGDASSRATGIGGKQSQGQTSNNTLEGSRSSSGGNEVGQDVNVDASDNGTYMVTYDNDYPVSTAANLFTQTCQQGVSAQGDDLGASAVFSDPLCDTLKVAATYWDYHILEHKHGNDEQAAYWKEKYQEQMEQVDTLMSATKEVAVADRFAGFLIKPLGVLALLVFLL